MAAAREQPGVEFVCDKDTAVETFGLCRDREGDVVVIGDRDTCIGTRESEHDLTGLAGHRLRSHGAIAEQKVPLIFNRPLNAAYSARARTSAPRNFQVFDYAINGVEA